MSRTLQKFWNRPILLCAYSPGIHRIIFVSEQDVWSVLHAAKLLHSKLPLHIYAFFEIQSDISNDNCHEWTIPGDRTALSVGETPLLFQSDSMPPPVRVGAPSSSTIPGEILLQQREFSLFVLRVVQAMRLTDALLNDYDKAGFLDLFAGVKNILRQSAADATGFPDGFVNTVEKILFCSSTINEALAGIDAMFADRGRPIKGWQQSYRDTFFDLLGRSSAS